MKRTLAVIAAVLLMAGLAACTSNNSSGGVTSGKGESTGGGTTTPTTQPIWERFDYNGLTGQYDMEKGSPNRPIALMVPNDSLSIGHQVGIDKADLYLECETEGGIPRLMAVFAGVERVPEKVGPLRSARSPFVAVARALGVIYCHAGGSGPAKDTLKTGVLDHFDALTDSKTFWRDEGLKAEMDYVHSLATSGEKLAAKIAKSGYAPAKQKELPFTFGTKTGTDTANRVQVNTTANHRVSFLYDAETGLYGKHVGKLSSCTPHTTQDGTLITATNVLVLYATKVVETTYANGTVLYDFKTGEGTGYLFSGGTYREITYTRTADSLSLRETDGATAEFAPGKIYMVLVDKKLASKQIVE